jgi:DNA sulfur modification protein DndE
MIETIRLSEKAKGQLITLKRRTGLQNWNVLCRWAFCLSISERSVPPREDIPADSSVEMTWRTFTGGHDGVYWGLLVARAKRDGVPLLREQMNDLFRLHLHRGISYLNSSLQMRGIADLVKCASRAVPAQAEG